MGVSGLYKPMDLTSLILLPHEECETQDIHAKQHLLPIMSKSLSMSANHVLVLGNIIVMQLKETHRENQSKMTFRYECYFPMNSFFPEQGPCIHQIFLFFS